MNTKYMHLEIEKNKNQKWIDNKVFSIHDETKKSFCIILPPPNITGKLHLGHAWDSFIQDTIIRYKKLEGFDVLFIPSMDHAGIATQAKVEEELRSKNYYKKDLNREFFLQYVWKWKKTHAFMIRKQWAKLGLALDYEYERFTMDSGLSKAVSKVFIKMYNKGLIYKGVKPINWDPVLKTVISNIEVISKDTKSKMVYIRYAIKNSKESIEIATTRPETMFSDVAIAINKHNKKLSHFIGNIAINPLTKKELPIIEDEYIHNNKGTGAMKVSAHAIPDFDIIVKNDLEVLESIDKDGKMNHLANEYEGLDRFIARSKIINFLEKQNYIIKIEKITNQVAYSERSGAIVEILVQPQWFVKMKPLANNILDHINQKDGVNFYPKRFKNILINWMENIKDWPISRQLWWGHRLPIWYNNSKIKIQVESPGNGWIQDGDVLDTWFSSALAPFSFLGWPDNIKHISRYYPTNLLVTGYDIIFFWVARMYFQGIEFLDKKPFNEVLIHGLIRDENGIKMSKSLGNGIDPMDVIEKYGSDALRWFLLTNSTPGKDIRYSSKKINAAWGLANKLWNISRYILEIMDNKETNISEADEWITEKISKVKKLVVLKIKTYEFTIIGKELARFIMDDFSSWYIEFTKATPNKQIAINILKELLIILHPFMPFITDHIYNLIDNKEILDQTLKIDNSLNSTIEIDEVILIIKAIREFRATTKLATATKIFFFSTKHLSINQINMISKLANAFIEENNDSLITLGNFNIFIKLSKEMKATESKRISKQIEYLENEISRSNSMLLNKNFLEKAPRSKVMQETKKLEIFNKEIKILKEKKNEK